MTSLPQTRPAMENQVPMMPSSEKWLDNLRRAMGRSNGRPILMGGVTISKKQHEAIKSRQLTLRKAITADASDRPATGAEIARLLAAFPATDAGMSTALRVEAYSDALGTAPAWAVYEARLKVVRGETKGLDQRFMPTPPQFANLVREILRPWQAELADLTCLVSIDPEIDPTFGERARINAGFEKLKFDLAASQTTYGPRSAHQIYEDAMGFEKPA